MIWSRDWRTRVWQMVSLVIIVALLMTLALPAQAALAADLDELQVYATEMKPLIEGVVALAQEDADIIKEAKAGNPDALCDGRLAENGIEMASLQVQIAGVTPPADAAQIHDKLLTSLDDYLAGADRIADYCATGKKVQVWHGLVRMAAARLKFGGAIIDFNLLLLQSGLEEFQARFPGSDFEALLEYGADIGPDYRAWGELIAAEGPAIEAALGDNPEALCATHIASDIPDMQAILDSFQAVNVPDAASDVHAVVVTGANAWLLGLENSGNYCTATTDWEKAIYLATLKVNFGVGLTAYAGALAQYADALQQAWRDMWR